MCSRSCYLRNPTKPHFHPVLWAPRGVTNDQRATMRDTASLNFNLAAPTTFLGRARLILTTLTTSNYYYTVMEWFNMILLPSKSTTYRQEVQMTHTHKKHLRRNGLSLMRKREVMSIGNFKVEIWNQNFQVK